MKKQINNHFGLRGVIRYRMKSMLRRIMQRDKGSRGKLVIEGFGNDIGIYHGFGKFNQAFADCCTREGDLISCKIEGL